MNTLHFVGLYGIIYVDFRFIINSQLGIELQTSVKLKFGANIDSEAYFIKDKLEIRSATTVNARKLFIFLCLCICLSYIYTGTCLLVFETCSLRFSEEGAFILELCFKYFASAFSIKIRISGEFVLKIQCKTGTMTTNFKYRTFYIVYIKLLKKSCINI